MRLSQSVDLLILLRMISTKYQKLDFEHCSIKKVSAVEKL
jgi:hypothetical protein